MQRKKENGPECELSEKAGDVGGRQHPELRQVGTLAQRKAGFSLEKDWNGKGGRRFAEMITEGQDISIWWLLFSLCGGKLSHLLRGGGGVGVQD